MTKGKVLLASPVHELLIDGLKKAGYELVLAENIREEEAPALIGDAVGVITSTRLRLNKELLDKAPLLQWIGRMGSGMELIDVAYANEKGIRCFSSPDGNCNAVAEHALGMLLTLSKRIALSNEEVKRGLWLRNENRGWELEGKTVGIIGFGHTGKAFARKLSGFDVRTLAYDKYHRPEMDGVVPCDSLEPLYAGADIISFHVPLQSDTFHYLDEKFIVRMQRPFVVINTSRGDVVDTVALHEGLLDKKIVGACLDVIEEEPPVRMCEKMHELFIKLRERPDVVFTPHIAGYSFEALQKMSVSLLHKILPAPTLY